MRQWGVEIRLDDNRDTCLSVDDAEFAIVGDCLLKQEREATIKCRIRTSEASFASSVTVLWSSFKYASRMT